MKKCLIILSTLTVGAGALYYVMSKRKRRRLLETKPETSINNKVSQDLHGTVPGPLFKYLRGRDNSEITKGDYTLWGYSEVINFSASVSQSLEDDILVILGINEALTEQIGRPVYLMYSKVGYPETLIETILKEDGNLEYHRDIKYNVLL